MAFPSVSKELLALHLEEFEFLWEQRQATLRSPRRTLRDLLELEERLEAHIEGLLVGGDQLVPLIQPALFDEQPSLAFVAAYLFLRLDRAPLKESVLAAFTHAKGGQLAGIQQALCHVPIAPILPQLRRFLGISPVPIEVEVLVAVAEILGFQGKLELKTQQMDNFLKHKDPRIRQAGWRAAKSTIPRPAETYQMGLLDGSPAVRREAGLAAAWSRQAWLIGECRKAALKPTLEHWDLLVLLAILGKPGELGHLIGIGGSPNLGPQRFQLLGAYGHPHVMDIVLAGIENPDPLTAVAAGKAFRKITGKDIDSSKRVTLPPADGSEPDEFEKEFLEEVWLPSPELARAQWGRLKEQFFKGTRWCRGINLSKGVSPEVLGLIDLESRWEVCLRGKFDGTWHGSPAELEQFPQKRPA